MWISRRKILARIDELEAERIKYMRLFYDALKKSNKAFDDGDMMVYADIKVEEMAYLNLAGELREARDELKRLLR